MLKRLYSWHIKQRRFKLSKSSFIASGNAKKKSFSFFKRNHYYFASENSYIPEKRIKRNYFWHLLLGIMLVIFFGWFLLECYRGWNVFQL